MRTMERPEGPKRGSEGDVEPSSRQRDKSAEDRAPQGEGARCKIENGTTMRVKPDK
jgi:hypothetical protein